MIALVKLYMISIIIFKVKSGLLDGILNICCGGRSQPSCERELNPEIQWNLERNPNNLLKAYQQKSTTNNQSDTLQMGMKQETQSQLQSQEQYRQESSNSQTISIDEQLIEFREDNDIPDDCVTQRGLYQQLVENNQFLGEGSFGRVYEYKNYAYKTIEENQQKPSRMQLAIAEYKNLKLLQDYDNQHQTYLFQDGIECFIDTWEDDFFIILKQKLVGTDLEFTSKKNNGGQQFFQLNRVRDDQDFRFKLYIDLFQQLVVFKKLNKVHKDIKPENIVTNVNLQKLFKFLKSNVSNKEKIKAIDNLSLQIIDMGLMMDYQTKRFAGSPRFMHPKNYFEIEQKSLYDFDVYTLALSVGIIEMYPQKSQNYIFQNFDNLDIKNQLQFYEQKYKQKLDLENLNKLLENQIENYRQTLLNQLCDVNQVKTMRRSLRNFQIQNYKQVYQEICQQCYGCVLASALQLEVNNIPTAEQIIQGLQIVYNNKSKIKKDKRIIVQLILYLFLLFIYIHFLFNLLQVLLIYFLFH